MPKHLFVGLWDLTVIALLTACSGQQVSPSARPGTSGALTPTPLAR
jgi:hypothetical protein